MLRQAGTRFTFVVKTLHIVGSEILNKGYITQLDGANESWDVSLQSLCGGISLRSLWKEIIEFENAEFRKIIDERLNLSAFTKAKTLKWILDNR